MLAKKKIYAEDIAQALDVNVGFLENLVGMEIPKKPRIATVVVYECARGCFYGIY